MSCTEVQLASPVLICQTAYASYTSSPSIATRLPLFALAWSTHLLTGNSKFGLRRSIVNLCEFFGKSLGSTMHIVFELENPSSSDPAGVPLWRFRSRPFWPVSSSTRGNTGAPSNIHQNAALRPSPCSALPHTAAEPLQVHYHAAWESILGT